MSTLPSFIALPFLRVPPSPGHLIPMGPSTLPVLNPSLGRAFLNCLAQRPLLSLEGMGVCGVWVGVESGWKV